MYFFIDFENYFKMVRLAWNEKVPRARSHYLAVLLICAPVIAIFHAIFFFLDGLVFPDLKRVEMRDPIFMVGHARSGTTFTHRLLCKDSERFSSFRLYELYFPSLIQKKIIRAIGRFDEEWLGGFLTSRVRVWEERRYGAGRHMHSMGLTEPEEDDILFYWSMAAGIWITKMPYMGDLDFYHMNDWPERKRRKYNDFYRECVKRQLYLNGPGKIHLSKNPMYSGRVASLIEAFPDARFIVNVRNPYETIPSMLSLVRSSWKKLGWDEDRQKQCLRILADQSWHTYHHPLDTLEANPNIRSAVVDYRDLMTDPAMSIDELYRELDIPMSDEYRNLLVSEGKRARDRKNRHVYSLSQFGLETGAIHAELATLFERFNWDVEGGVAERSPDGHEREER